VDEDQGEPAGYAGEEPDPQPASIYLCLYWVEFGQGWFFT